jgi:hypothetical protein
MKKEGSREKFLDSQIKYNQALLTRYKEDPVLKERY